MNEFDFMDLGIRFAVYIIPVLLGWGINIWRQNSNKIAERIEAEIGERWWKLLREGAETLIHAAEQITGIDTNEEKKDFVLNQLVLLAEAWKVPLTREQIGYIVEGVYKDWVKDNAWHPITRTEEEDKET